MPFAKIVWLLVFFFLLTLSMDFWRWSEPVELGWLGLPTWLGYFVALHICFTITLAMHARWTPAQVKTGVKK